MKLTFKPGTIRGMNCLRAIAYIGKSRKKNIPRNFQKTWTMQCMRPDVVEAEIKLTAERTAKRWEEKIMQRIADEKQTNGDNHEPTQKTHSLNPTPEAA